MVRVRQLEVLGRRLHAVQLDVQDRIDRSGVFKADGHASAKVMVRHGANLSNGEALRREQAVKMLRALPGYSSQSSRTRRSASSNASVVAAASS